jgi:uncharacterized membrane protein
MLHSNSIEKGTRIWLWIIIIGVLTTGVFFRFYNIEKKVYWGDETYTSLIISGYTWAEAAKSISDREVGIEDLKRFQFPNRERGIYSTIRALSEEDPQHPPLYYGFVRMWTEWFGDSVWTIRSFSVLCGLLSFPCLFWLCRELFESRWVPWMAVALLAVSPLNVLQSQEARQYSLWTLTILISSATLLRALSSEAKSLWILYTATIVFGIYTHILFIMVIAAHSFYAFGIYLNKDYLWPLQLPREFKSYIIATLAGLIAFIPWSYIIFIHYPTVKSDLSWVNFDPGLIHLIGQWGFNYSSVFFDVGYALKFTEGIGFYMFLSYFIRVLILVILAYSIYFLYFNARIRTWLFIVALVLIPFLLLALPDVILRGTRSGNGYKFLVPSYIGVQLAVSYLLTTKIINSINRSRRFWQSITAMFIISGIVSCIIITQAESWWTKPDDYYTPQVMSVINQAHQPLVIIESTQPARILSFSHRGKEDVRFLVVEQIDNLNIPGGSSDVFVYKPSYTLRNKLEHTEGYTIGSVNKYGLWRLKKAN